jgi:hypothetical protein
MPGWNVLVCQAGSDIKHDDGTLPMDVVSISKTAKLLLAGSIPAVEPQPAAACGEIKRMNLHTDGGCKPQASISSQTIPYT